MSAALTILSLCCLTQYHTTLMANRMMPLPSSLGTRAAAHPPGAAPSLQQRGAAGAFVYWTQNRYMYPRRQEAGEPFRPCGLVQTC
jgi:hypothetical protein